MVRGLHLVLLLISTHLKLFAQEGSQSDGQEAQNTENGVDFISKTEEKLLSSIFKGYNSRVRPCGAAKAANQNDEMSEQIFGKCGPTDIAVFVFLRSVDEINDKDMSYDLQMLFRQMWVDQRLAYKKHLPENYNLSYLSLSPDDQSHKPWLPDTFFINEKEGYRHEIDKGNIMLRISPEGEVTYSFRVTLTLACQMDFSEYPMDEHKCGLDISSYGNTMQHVVYNWRESSAVLISTQFKNNAPTFEVEQVKRDLCEVSTTTGVYSCLRVIIFFKRIFSYAQFLHLYLPGLILVCMSWLCFWLSPQAIIVRSTFGLFCFLTLTIQSSISAPTLPPTSTIRSCDLWFTVCLCFLILNLFQLVIIHRLNRLEQHHCADSSICGGLIQLHQTVPHYNPSAIKFAEEETGQARPTSLSRLPAKRSLGLKPKKSLMHKSEHKLSVNHAEPIIPLMEEEKDKDPTTLMIRRKPNIVVRKWRKCSRSQKFDVICRGLFPCMFFFFNVIYWTY